MTGNKVTIDAATLNKAMKFASGVVEARNTIPILSNVRLHAQGDMLEIVSTDLDIELRQSIPLSNTAAEPMATTVDARRFAALAGSAEKAAQITLDLSDGRMTVKSGRSRWVLPVLPSTDFPVLPATDFGPAVIMSGKDLAAAIHRTLWSASTEVTRYYLNGALLHGEDGKLSLVTTDGNTLVRQVTDVVWPAGVPEVIAPTKYLSTLENIAGDAAEVHLSWTEGKVRAEFGNTVLTGKTVQAAYPDYRRVIPSLRPAPVVFDPELLTSAIRRVALVDSGKTRSAKVTGSNGSLKLAVTSPDSGSAFEEMPAVCEVEFEAGFNVQFLAQMADAVGGDSIAMHQDDPCAPARFQRVVPDGCLCIVMPMRV